MAAFATKNIKITPISPNFVIKSKNEPMKNGQFVITKYTEQWMRGAFLPYSSTKKRKKGAVSGIIISKNGILIARRAGHVNQYPNFFECVPSGALQQVDHKAQLLEELIEETSIDPVHIERSFLLFLIEDQETQTVDICSLIQLDDLCIPTVNKEYTDAQWIYLDELLPFSYQHRNEFVPTSLILIENAIGMLEQLN
jgi:hypothetical protein